MVILSLHIVKNILDYVKNNPDISKDELIEYTLQASNIDISEWIDRFIHALYDFSFISEPTFETAKSKIIELLGSSSIEYVSFVITFIACGVLLFNNDAISIKWIRLNKDVFAKCILRVEEKVNLKELISRRNEIERDISNLESKLIDVSQVDEQSRIAVEEYNSEIQEQISHLQYEKQELEKLIGELV